MRACCGGGGCIRSHLLLFHIAFHRSDASDNKMVYSSAHDFADQMLGLRSGAEAHFYLLEQLHYPDSAVADAKL